LPSKGKNTEFLFGVVPIHLYTNVIETCVGDLIINIDFAIAYPNGAGIYESTRQVSMSLRC